MISIRNRIILVIISIVIGITSSSLVMGFLFSGNRFMETVRDDMTVISHIAEEMISKEISLIKEKVRSTAGLVEAVEDTAIYAILEAEFEWHHYLNLTVLGPDRIIASYGDLTETTGYYSANKYAKRAFQGEIVMSTTEYSLNGDLIIRVWAPIGKNRVLVAIVPGLIFADIVSKFQIWKSGTIFILDNEGTFIAYRRLAVVLERNNYIEKAKTEPSWQNAANFYKRMIMRGNGVGNYNFNGITRLCAYTEINGTDGWMLGVAAPIKESPLSQINQVLGISAMVFLLLGILTALITANSIATPFEQIREQNLRLEELKRTAESASEAKSHFLANMSHEMRTPLNAIIGLSELELGSDNLSGTAYENLEKIYISGMTLLGIINDILDISKIESGKFTLIPVEYELPSFINDTVNLNAVRIGSKPIDFKLHIHPNLPLKLIGDELRIKQIFNNLLSNAFKYTEEGIVEWHLSSELEEDSVWLISSVVDTGIGIAAKNLPKLFIDYNQLNTKSNRRIEGTGLGLSITKNMVELMDGKITVKSELGKGSVFSLRIRQKRVNDSVIGEEISKNLEEFKYTADRRFRNEKLIRCYIPYAAVLVVDDVAINLDVAKGMLKPYGMTVDCVDSGQKAIDLIREEKIKYNAIFMDHMMPNMDGIEAVQIIRNEIGSEYAETVPIIALTANAIIGNDELFLRNGFQAFLSKPIDILSMDIVINRYIRNKKLEKELPYSNAAPHLAAPKNRSKTSFFTGKSLENINFSTGLRRFDNNEETYLNLLKSYFSLIQTLPKTIRTYTPESHSRYTIAVHSLKSTSYTIGANRIGKRAADLEAAANSGDTEFINANNAALINILETLIPKLESFLEDDQNTNPKPLQAAPDPALLAKALKAAADYDIEQLDAAMDELELYHYETQSELIAWLREQINMSEFEKIKECLSKIIEGV